MRCDKDKEILAGADFAELPLKEAVCEHFEKNRDNSIKIQQTVQSIIDKTIIFYAKLHRVLLDNISIV